LSLTILSPSNQAYEKLWDDVKKQFLKHTDSDVLDQAVRTIAHFLQAADLSTENQTKLPELEDALLAALRQCVNDKDIESATFEEDEIHNLAACIARVDKLSRVKNITALEDTDGGKQTSVWEILDSIVNRGRLGYKEEAEVCLIPLLTTWLPKLTFIPLLR
jgi:cohesin complex subunit SA-1/2